MVIFRLKLFCLKEELSIKISENTQISVENEIDYSSWNRGTPRKSELDTLNFLLNKRVDLYCRNECLH